MRWIKRKAKSTRSPMLRKSSGRYFKLLRQLSLRAQPGWWSLRSALR